MQYFYRAHCTPETVLEFAGKFFPARGFGGGLTGSTGSTYTDGRGNVALKVEIEGGHYTRVTVSTGDVGESEIDKVAKRFLADLRHLEVPRHRVRGAY